MRLIRGKHEHLGGVWLESHTVTRQILAAPTCGRCGRQLGVGEHPAQPLSA